MVNPTVGGTNTRGIGRLSVKIHTDKVATLLYPCHPGKVLLLCLWFLRHEDEPFRIIVKIIAEQIGKDVPHCKAR